MSEPVPENVTKSSYSSKYQDKTPEQSFSERALFVFNICYDTTEGELKELFHRFGPAKVKLMMTEHLNKNRGHAFVEYQDPSHAKEAVKHLNGYSLQDTKIKVQFNTKQPPWYAGNGHNNRKHCDNPPSNSVYVRNLDNSITSEDLEGQFSRFSPLKVSLVIDHVTKRNKGYAFVDFSSIEDAANAIKHTNGAMFYGRQLHVEFSNRSCNLDSRKSESISSLNSDLDDLELTKLRQDRERLEDELSEKKIELEDAKSIGCEDSIQLVREHIWRLQDDIARIKLAEDYPPNKTRARSQDKRKKKRRSDEGDQYYSDERENTPGIERSYTPTSFGSRRSHHRGSISSNSSQGDDGYLEHRVFVGGLNHTTTPETFKGFFSKFGKISSYFLKWDKISGRNKGFGFVSYDTAEQMESLLATHKESTVVIDNHAVNIKRVFPESYVSPFPLNIPPMLCRAAPHFTDPPPYCDERNPLPDDQKIVEFFYNLGIHHYNLLRINVYHWNLLFPGNMFSNAKMDSAPPTRQPSPAPPPFPAPPAMPVFSNLDQQHRPATHMGPMMPTHIPTQRTMYPQQNNYPRHSNPMFHDMMIPNKFYNKNQKNSRSSTPQLRTAPTAAGMMPHKPVDYNWELIKKYLLQKFSSNHRGSHQFNNNSNKSRGMGNNFHNNNNNYLNNFHHNNYHNNNSNNNNSHHNSHTNVRTPLDSLQQPIRLQQHDRRNHLDHSRPPSNKSGPDKVTNGPPVSFSPTHFSPQSTLQPFSPEIFSPSKVTNSPAHSSPPQPHPPPTIPPPTIPPLSVSQQTCPVEETQNNSSYGSHEDTLTFESTEQAEQGYTPGYQPPNSATLHKPHPLPVQTNLPHESTLSPPPSVTRPLERSRSSSGSYTEGVTEKGNTIQYTHSEKGALPQKPPHMTPNQPNMYPQIYQNLQPPHRHQVPPRLQQEKHMKSDGTQPPVQPTPNHMTEELNKMHRLRNLPQPGPNFHGPVHGGGFTDFHSGDKNQRLDTRSPGIPPGYSSIPYSHAQLLSFLQLGQLRPGLLPQTMAGLIPGPQAMPPHPLPPHTQSRYHDHSPPPSEDESEDDSRQ